MIGQRLDLIMNKLSCTNSDLARETSYDQSTISRYRHGRRTLHTSSEAFERLCTGIYRYADNNNLIEVLSGCIGYDRYDDGTFEALCKWMESGENDTEYATEYKYFRKNDNRFFGVKLNSLMNACEISNVRLARMLTVDPSYISRMRGGVRIPRRNSDIIKQLCRAIVNKSFDVGTKNDIASLVGLKITEDCKRDYLYDKVYAWLNDNHSNAETQIIGDLLDVMESYQEPEHGHFSNLPVEKAERNLRAREYRGIKGLYSAFTRFLTICSMVKGKNIYLYSDFAFDWVIVDTKIYQDWATLFRRVLEGGNRIKIIHTVKRNTAAILAALRQWLPVYMNGMIEPYYSDRNQRAMFSNTLMILEGVACLRGSSAKGCEDDALYYFVTDRDKLLSSQREFSTMLMMAVPLARIFAYNDSSDFNYYLGSIGMKDGDVSLVMPNFSVCTMPKELFETILGKNMTDEKTKESFLAHYLTAKSGFDLNMQTGHRVREFICLPSRQDLSDGKVLLNLNNMYTEKNIAYDESTYKDHLRAIIRAYDENKNYRIYILPQNYFANLRLIIKGKCVILIRSSKPYTALAITNSFLCNAFYSWIDNLKERFLLERSEVRKALIQYIES